jgi:hypothetical protein
MSGEYSRHQREPTVHWRDSVQSTIDIKDKALQKIVLTLESIQQITLHPSSSASFFVTRTPIGHDKRTSGVREVPRSRSACSLSNGTSEGITR